MYIFSKYYYTIVRRTISFAGRKGAVLCLKGRKNGEKGYKSAPNALYFYTATE